MKQSQRNRIVALLLLVATLIGVMPFAVGSYAATGSEADDESYSDNLYGGRTLEEILVG